MPGPLISEPPEPLSRRALEILRTAGQRCRERAATRVEVRAEIEQLDAFIQNSRSDRLRTELRRYCDGEQDGVSILLSGTRGAGKTTTAKLAVQQLIAESILRPPAIAPPATRMVPLPIVLHGPTLMTRFSDADEPRIAELERKQAEDGHTLGIAARRRRDRSDAVLEGQSEATRFRDWEAKARLKRTVLRGLVTALFKHIAMMLTEAWEEAARQDGGSDVYSSLSMLRAHLELTLDEGPDEAILRRIWRRAGKLRCGVMHHLYLPLDGDSLPLPLRPDQGLREIVALAACGKSYLGILGDTKEVMGRKLASGEKAYLEMGVASQGGEGGGEKKDEKKGKENGGWRLIPRFRTGSERSRDASGSRDLTVEVDWSERRLERELPHLLRRVKAAGIAPIFILDELDKLDDADHDLDDFLQCSKHIVRDHAAFVFLPDRDYMIRLERGRA